MADRNREILWTALFVVGGLLFIWLIVVVIWNVGPILGAAIVSGISAAVGFVGWLVTVGVVLSVGVVAIMVPLYIGSLAFKEIVRLLNVGIEGIVGVDRKVVIVGADIKGVGGKVTELDTKIDGVGDRFGGLLQKVTTTMSESARDSAIDTGFLGFAALLAGAVFWVSTNDFLGTDRNAEFVKTLALVAVYFAAAKFLLMFPVRRLKIFAIAVFFVSLVCIGIYFYFRYSPNVDDVLRVVEESKERVAAANVATLAALSIIVLLIVTSVLYPFSWTRWGKMLTAK